MYPTAPEIPPLSPLMNNDGSFHPRNHCASIPLYHTKGKTIFDQLYDFRLLCTFERASEFDFELQPFDLNKWLCVTF